MRVRSSNVTNAEAAIMSKPSIHPRPIELLAPARDTNVAREAILHGADAVYIGASSHGARRQAANPLSDIASLVEFAHQYRAKVYVTVNTIIYDDELKSVRELIRQLYVIGVDAIIVQDMGILKLDIPPIELHASTQCDTRTPSKAKFLEDVGFSQIVLARELGLKEIREICEAVTVPVECFVHGALCVSYSGRCNASYATNGRSANRGECSQICRLPFTLTDARGNVLARDKHLLSLRDFNASHSIHDMLEAGVSSFKIEGRLKDASYVKNVTAYYRKLIDKEIALHPDKYCRSSYGESTLTFSPNPEKSFNRGFTDYFLTDRRPNSISSPDTPKSLGEEVKDRRNLHNGDGVSFFNKKDGKYTGAYVNGLAKDGSILTSGGFRIPPGVSLRLTYDKEWEKRIEGKTAERKIDVDISLDEKGVSATDARGNFVRIPLGLQLQKADKPQNHEAPFAKTGSTVYRLKHFSSEVADMFIPASMLTGLRRTVLSELDEANKATYPLKLRRAEKREAVYPEKSLIFSDNVANRLAEEFYRSHGVEHIEPAMEKESPSHVRKGTRLMTTRHCILRELGRCIKNRRNDVALPLTLSHGKERYMLEFDCRNCEMHLLK